MPNTARDRDELYTLFADNTTGNITPQYLRDFVASTLLNTDDDTVLQLAAGSVSEPSLYWSSDSTRGFTRIRTACIDYVGDNLAYMRLQAATFGLSAGTGVKWLSSGGGFTSSAASYGLGIQQKDATAGSGFLEINDGSTASYAGLICGPSTTSNVGLIVKGRTSQSADLTQWQNVGGSILGNVNASGGFGIGDSNGGGTSLYVLTPSTSAVGIMVRGRSSQTGNLQEWQNNSSTILASIGSDGRVSARAGLRITDANNTGPLLVDWVSAGFVKLNASGDSPAIGIGNVTSVGTVARLTVNANSTADNAACVHLNADAAARKPLVIQGFASQSANLTEWQNSTSTVLAKITAGGDITARAVFLATGVAPVQLYYDGAGGSLKILLGPTYGSGSFWNVQAGSYTDENNKTKLGSTLDLANDSSVRFSSTSLESGSKDCGLARASAGSVKVTDGSSGAGDLEFTDNTKGVILKSPDGTRWRVTVEDDGSLTTTSL